MFASSRHNIGRKIKKYDLEVENAECIELYEKMISSGLDEDRQAYTLYILNRLDGLIKKHIKAMDFYRAADVEDLEQQARCVIMTKVFDYNPHTSMPSSFFSILIDQGLKEAAIGASHLSANYLQLKSKFNNIAKDNGFDGMTDPKLTPQMLAELSGESLVTIKNTMELVKVTHVSLLDVTETASKNTVYDSPERQAMKSEEAHFIATAFQTLTEYEQFLITKQYLEEDPETRKCLSARSVSNALKKEEKLVESLGLKKAPTAAEVEDATECALRKLRHQPGMRERYGKRQRHQNRSYTIVEQAPIEIIESAINSDDVMAI